VYTIFPSHSPSYTLSLYPPPPSGSNLPNRTCLPFCSLFL
jgi:hypothetical protein